MTSDSKSETKQGKSDSETAASGARGKAGGTRRAFVPERWSRRRTLIASCVLSTGLHLGGVFAVAQSAPPLIRAEASQGHETLDFRGVHDVVSLTSGPPVVTVDLMAEEPMLGDGETDADAHVLGVAEARPRATKGAKPAPEFAKPAPATAKPAPESLDPVAPSAGEIIRPSATAGEPSESGAQTPGPSRYSAGGGLTLLTSTAPLAGATTASGAAMPQPLETRAIAVPFVSSGVAQSLRVYDDFPAMPDRVKGAGFPQTVNVEICVSERGDVTRVTADGKASPMLERTLVNAIRNWRYRPFQVAGNPSPFCHQMEIRYEF